MSKPIVYFAHPMTLYRKPIELTALKMLKEAGFTVVNPSDDDFADDFEAYRAAHPESYMQYFVDRCNLCDEAAFMCFPDDVVAKGVPQVPNRVGAGVILEVESFWKRRARVWYIQVTGQKLLLPVSNWAGFYILSLDETRAMLKAMNPNYTNWRNK